MLFWNKYVCMPYTDPVFIVYGAKLNLFFELKPTDVHIIECSTEIMQ